MIEIPDDPSAAGPVPGVAVAAVVSTLRRLAEVIREKALIPEDAARLADLAAENVRRDALAMIRDPQWLTEPWSPTETHNPEEN